MEDQVYIILFDDESIMLSLQEPQPQAWQAAARFFSCDSNITLEDIVTPVRLGWKIDRLPHNIINRIHEIEFVAANND